MRRGEELKPLTPKSDGLLLFCLAVGAAAAVQLVPSPETKALQGGSDIEDVIPIADIHRGSLAGFNAHYSMLSRRLAAEGKHAVVDACRTPGIGHESDDNAFLLTLKNGDKKLCSFRISESGLKALEAEEPKPPAALFHDIEGMIRDGDIGDFTMTSEMAEMLQQTNKPTSIVMDGHDISHAYGSVAPRSV